MTTILIAAAGLSLCACQTQPIETMSYSQKKELVASLIERCVKQGVDINSPEMGPCVRSEVGREFAVREQNRQSARAFAGALSDFGGDMQRNAQAQADRAAMIQAAQAGNRISCTSNRYGNTVQTNCY